MYISRPGFRIFGMPIGSPFGFSFATGSGTHPPILLTNMNASLVIGQADFTHGAANRAGSIANNGFSSPQGIVSDGTRLFICDGSNNRVLVWNTIPTGDTPADIVFGQADFTHGSANQGSTVNANTLSNPRGIGVFGKKLLIADSGNNRVVIINDYTTLPTQNGNANVAIGQADLIHGTAGILNAPRGMFVDVNGKVFIANTGGNSILIYNAIPTSSGVSADLILTKIAATGPINTFIAPSGVYSDGVNLLLVDKNDSRVLYWSICPAVDVTAATIVIGQINFTTATSPPPNTAATLFAPYAAIMDAGRVIIADYNDNRVLVYNGVPAGNGANADVVIGQADFVSVTANQGNANPAANTLSGPGNGGSALCMARGRLFVCDQVNNRVLAFG